MGFDLELRLRSITSISVGGWKIELDCLMSSTLLVKNDIFSGRLSRVSLGDKLLESLLLRSVLDVLFNDLGPDLSMAVCGLLLALLFMDFDSWVPLNEFLWYWKYFICIFPVFALL